MEGKRVGKKRKMEEGSGFGASGEGEEVKPCR